ncbi:MAG: ParB N-terminal domain-containing protein [Microbacterium sp.]
MSADVVQIDAIRIEDRARREYRGIDSLAASIDSVGLLHPPVVTTDLRLIAGGRRLEALRVLGWEMVPVTMIDSLSGASLLLQAESDENTEREPLTLSEASDLARKIEGVLKPLAAARQSPGRPQKNAAKFAAIKEVRPREVAAKAAGVSHETIRKVRHVQEVIESDTTPAPVREIAVSALREMNATGKADAGHKKVTQAERAAELAGEFPDLQFYIDQGDTAHAVSLGLALRSYEEPERSVRLDAMRKHIAAAKRRTEPESAGPDYEALADQIFVAVNNALQVIEKNGGSETIRAAVATANPLAVELWRSQFERIQPIAAELLHATRPVLRRVQ